MHWRIRVLLLLLSLIISSCGGIPTVDIPTVISTGILTPFQTKTPEPTAPTATVIIQIPETPAPTPTPFLYTVKNDDTMLGIAYKFDVSLQDLQAANPTVDPHFMGPGLQLVIPLGGDVSEIIPTATAYPINITQPKCYPVGDGGLWCVASLHNDQDISLENLSIWIGLYNPQGKNIASQNAFAPLDNLKPGDSMPMMVYFPPPIEQDVVARCQILSASPVNNDDPRYINVELEINKVDIHPESDLAIVSGVVILPPDISTPSQVWVIAVAYDVNGNIVGAKKWKSAGDTQFNVTVYSMASSIDHVDVLAEARP